MILNFLFVFVGLLSGCFIRLLRNLHFLSCTRWYVSLLLLFSHTVLSVVISPFHSNPNQPFLVQVRLAFSLAYGLCVKFTQRLRLIKIRILLSRPIIQHNSIVYNVANEPIFVGSSLPFLVSTCFFLVDDCDDCPQSLFRSLLPVCPLQ